MSNEAVKTDKSTRRRAGHTRLTYVDLLPDGRDPIVPKGRSPRVGCIGVRRASREAEHKRNEWYSHLKFLLKLILVGTSPRQEF